MMRDPQEVSIAEAIAHSLASGIEQLAQAKDRNGRGC